MNGRSGVPSAKTGISQDSGFAGWRCSCFGVKVTGAVTQKRLVQSGSSYISQEDKRLHFGLGKAAIVESIEVLWPDGTTSTLTNVKSNQILEVRQP
jgi:ASPIC/UnbV protein